jgi:IclR family pca regulon transcriptional regulator
MREMGMQGLEAQGDPNFMTSLARGLEVLRCFADQDRPLTIADVASRTGLSRPAVGRCLHTLVRLGYATQIDRRYELLPRVLSLGYAYLSSNPLPQRVQPLLDALRKEVGESCSFGVLEDEQLRYVARSESRRILEISLRPGSRLPLFATSMGRVLLADFPLRKQEEILRRSPLKKFTPHTETDVHRLLAILASVAEQGFAIVDQELDLGLRSVAVPVRKGSETVGAINIGMQSARVSMAEVHSRFLPALRRACGSLEFWDFSRKR